MEIYSIVELNHSQMPFNMAKWYTEKSREVTFALAILADLVRKLPDNSDTSKTKDEMNNVIATALYDATKLLSTSMGAGWDPKDRDHAFDKGLNGGLDIHAKYQKDIFGATTTTQVNRHELMEKFLTDAAVLARGPRSNRTLLNALLDTGGDYWFHKDLSDALDEVNMGTSTLESFQLTLAKVIEHFKAHPDGTKST